MGSALGAAAGSGISIGASAQVSLVKDRSKFCGSGAEHGVNLPTGGLALNHAASEPGGEIEPNGITESLGPSIGFDAHYYEGTTERLSLSKPAARLSAFLISSRRLLGATAAGVSALIASAGYAPGNRDLVSEGGVWWRETKAGRRRLSVIPPSLRMWVDALNGYRPKV